MISACLIVKNEEKWIEECIFNLQSLCSEIIVADTGSSDHTLEVLKRLQVKWFQIPWEFHFANARNATIAQATQPWIFSFDADEKINFNDIEKFRSIISDLDRRVEFEALRLVRRNYITRAVVSGFKPCRGEYTEEKKYPGYYEERPLRIFRNRPYIRWTGKVHEMIEPSLKGRIFESDLIFHHYGYLPEEEERRGKSKFYQEIGIAKIKEEPKSWKAYQDLGCEYLAVQKYKDGVEAFEKALALNPKEPMIITNYGYALMELGDLKKSEETLRYGLTIDSTNHDIALNLGVNLMRQQRLSDALDVLRSLSTNHPQSFLGFRNMGQIYFQLTRMKEAEDCFEKALQIFPQFHDARLDLAVARLMTGRLQPAKEALLEVQKQDPQNPRAQQILSHIEKSIRH